MAGVKPNLWDAFKQYLGDAAPGGALNPEVTPQGLLDVAAMASMPVPVVGDAIGLAADAKRLRDNPEERNLLNYVLMAAGALPLVPSGLSAARKALDKAGDASRTKTKYEIAHEIAQRNAALPVEKGGLGLPPDNTAMDRARAMGFDKDAYHGTSKDFPFFENAMRGNSTNARSAKEAHWLTSNPNTAAGYADLSTKSEVSKTLTAWQAAMDAGQFEKADKLIAKAEQLEQLAEFSGQNVMPLMLRGDFDNYLANGRTWSEIGEGGLLGVLKKAKDKSKDGVRFVGLRDDANAIGAGVPATHYGAFSPSNIRSRFAAFDPMRRDSSDLLAGIGVPILSGGLLALLMGSEDAQAGQ